MTAETKPEPVGDVTRWGVYPQEALDAAAAELGRQCHGGPADPDDIKLASDVLGVAAPIIQAAALDRTRLLKLISTHTGMYGYPVENLADAILKLAEGGSDGS